MLLLISTVFTNTDVSALFVTLTVEYIYTGMLGIKVWAKSSVSRTAAVQELG